MTKISPELEQRIRQSAIQIKEFVELGVTKESLYSFVRGDYQFIKVISHGDKEMRSALSDIYKKIMRE